MYASEEPGEEVERGRSGNAHSAASPAADPVVSAEVHGYDVGGEEQREDMATGLSGDT